MKNSLTSCYQYFSNIRILILVVGVVMVTATSCSDNSTGAGDSEGFTGSWSVENWSKSEIEGGTTSIDGSADSLMLSYNVNLDTNSGVSQRTAIYEVEVPTSGTVEFDWEYTGFHSFYNAFAELTVRSGSTTNVLVGDDDSIFSSFTFMGSASIAVTEGDSLQFEVGGSNFDEDTRLRGEVKIKGFELIP